MPAKCGNCGSADTSPLLDTFECFNCGSVTDYDGTVVEANHGSTEALVASLQAQVTPAAPAPVDPAPVEVASGEAE